MDLGRDPLSRRRAGAALLLVVLIAAAFAGRGLQTAHGARPRSLDRAREEVIRGVGRDFAAGTGVASRSFRSCFEGLMREALDPATIGDLATVYRRPGGPAYAAQLLNDLGSSPAARCGHRAWVPELTNAAHGLAHAHATGAAVRALGVTYGPYLGIRCDYQERRGCERVGIDIVFRRPATAVVAIAGSQRIHLATPGKHDGVRRHDWVGTFTRAGLLPDRPYELKAEPIYTALRVRVRFAGGHRREAVLPHVLIAPGWG